MFECFRLFGALHLRAILQTMLIAAVLLGSAEIASAAAGWRIALIPASNNRNEPVRLIAGHTQQLTVMLQASKEVQASAKVHEVELQFDLPASVEFIESGGNYEVLDVEDVVENQRRKVTLKVKVNNNRIAGQPGGVLLSEWQSHSLFVTTPDSVAPDAAYIQASVIAETGSAQEKWALELHELNAVADSRPKLTAIGFWDYDYNRAGKAAHGIGEFFAAAGATFTQKARDEFYPGMKANGITVGGDTHHSLFYTSEYPDYNVHGDRGHDYACPTCIMNAPADFKIGGVSQLLDHAHKYDGIATYDYEPGATGGFCPESIALFKEKYEVSDDDFELFRSYLAKHGTKTYKTHHRKIDALYRKWVLYRSWQTSEYVKRIQRAVYAQDPNVRIALTPNVGYDDDGPSTLGYGYNAAAMAPYVDIIMPQIYVGYGDAAAKLTMDFTRHWRDAIDAKGIDTELWPILLIRYAGASVYNAPTRMRQQIIGTLAHGAQGVLLYYPSNMDARYWVTLAQTSTEVAEYEHFYHNGNRVDEQFEFVDMPMGHAEISRYPAHKLGVENPQWATTAHELEGKILLTLFNLEEANDVLFTVNLPEGMKVVESERVEPLGDGKWLVSPRDVGFVVLAKADESAE